MTTATISIYGSTRTQPQPMHCQSWPATPEGVAAAAEELSPWTKQLRLSDSDARAWAQIGDRRIDLCDVQMATTDEEALSEAAALLEREGA